MIVIPMAGLSSRFKNAGYKLPKYMLEAHGKTLFEHSVLSFKNYFATETFLFIAMDIFETKSFIDDKCTKLGIKDYQIVTLDAPTRGQAETVYLGVTQANVKENESLLIFNIDTFRPGFTWPTEFDLKTADGYLETFIGSGDNWSNVLPDNVELQTTKLTAEKQGISEYCCTGLYYWKKCQDFCRICKRYAAKSNEELQAGELYIAPMYNDLIAENKTINYSVVKPKEVIFCGTPAEYTEVLNSKF